MYLIIATFITVVIIMEPGFSSMWVIPVCILAGLLFPPLHLKFVNDDDHAPVGLVFLLLAFAATLSIAMPKFSAIIMQTALLFLAGTLFYTAGKKAFTKAKVA